MSRSAKQYVLFVREGVPEAFSWRVTDPEGYDTARARAVALEDGTDRVRGPVEAEAARVIGPPETFGRDDPVPG